MLDADPAIAAMMPDVEAVLLRHLDPGFTAHVTSIDVCYELVGIVREHWEGLHGGDDVWPPNSSPPREARPSRPEPEPGRLRCPS